MFDIDQIRQLVDMMVSNDLMEISVRNGESELNLRRPNLNAHPAAAPQGVATVIQAPGPLSPTPAAAPAAPTPVESALVEIGSPMVGTFYSASDPNSPPFVQVGSPVSSGTVVCIIEAMKVFNEIKAEVSGTIERILVKNGQAVEYGQPMFLVRPH